MPRFRITKTFEVVVTTVVELLPGDRPQGRREALEEAGSAPVFQEALEGWDLKDQLLTQECVEIIED